jgi:predicted nucleotidyltransferase
MIRDILIRIALRLQFPPFIWIFRIYYLLAVKVSIYRIRKTGPVLAIYISGSAARGDVLYGLSDIDFKIFISGPTDKKVYKKVLLRFAHLRRWFPMLGPPDEKGIYFLDDFPSDYRNYPLVQHLFDERFYRHRLVWGSKIIEQLPLLHWSRLNQAQNFFWKLKDWMEKISILAGSRRLNRIQKQYLFFKATSDLSLIWMRLEHPEFPFQSREKVMEIMVERFTIHDVHILRDLLGERRVLFRRQLVGEGDRYLFFKRLLAACLEKIRYCENSPEGAEYEICRSQATTAPGFSAMSIDELRAISPAVVSIAAQPWPLLPRSPFDFAFFGKPAYRLDCCRPLDLTEAWNLKEYYRRQMNHQAVLLIREDTEWIYSADSQLVDHWLSMKGSDDLLWVFCEDAQRIVLSPHSEKGIRFRLAAFREQLHAALRGQDWGRMERDSFLPFIFNALAVMIFTYEFFNRRVLLPTTPDGVIGYLIDHTPLEVPFMDKLLAEYHAVAGGATFNEKLAEKAICLLVSVVSVAESGGSWQDLASVNGMPDEKHLDISVVIVTRNRCAKLERCLSSILLQTRLPEELVVIDSDSIDDTPQLVSQWKAPFPVRYINQSSPGVAAARNAGLVGASGEIIAFTDDDTIVTPKWLESLEYAFLRDRRIGIAGGSIYNMECGRKGSVAQFMRIVEKLQWSESEGRAFLP